MSNSFPANLSNSYGFLPGRPARQPLPKPVGGPEPACHDSVSLSSVQARAPGLEARVTEFWSTAFPELDTVSRETFVAVAARNLASLAWSTLKKTFPEARGEELVNGMLTMLRLLSPHSAAHSRRVGELATGLARELQMSEQEQKDLQLGAELREVGMLAVQLACLSEDEREELAESVRSQGLSLKAAGDIHDIGKLKLPPGILDKPGPLDDQEWELVRLHPVVGEYMLAEIPELARVLPAVRGHHERWDGAGYPDAFQSEQICLAARVLALADSYDAMTETRPYRRALSQGQAWAEILQGAGRQFDPGLTGLFLRMLARAA